jgi:hypothetical protein
MLYPAAYTYIRRNTTKKCVYSKLPRQQFLPSEAKKHPDYSENLDVEMCLIIHTEPRYIFIGLENFEQDLRILDVCS